MMSGVRELDAYEIVDGEGSNSALKRSKKRKKRAQSSDSWASANGWRKVDVEDMEIEGFEDGCAYEIEELTDYTLEKTESGGHMLVMKTATKNGVDGNVKATKKKNKRKRKKTKTEETHDEVEEEEASEPEADDHDHDVDADEDEQVVRPITKKQQKTEPPTKKVDEKPVQMPKWAKYKLHPVLLRSLHRCGFQAPTPIQERTILPAVIDNRDVVGAAPTGSGKTLAFGLPILSQLLYEKDEPGYTKDCKSLILTPTRELALQIHKHLDAMVPNREIGVMTLVGGMSVQRQTRMLSYSPEIVIGTPGRLWDLMESKHAHLKDVHETLRFLVIDEADRMLQKGSYPEVEKIFEVLRQSKHKYSNELEDLSDNDEDSGEEEDDEDDEGMALGGEAKVTMLEDVLRMHKVEQEDDENEGEQVASEEAEGDEDDEAVPMAAKSRPPRQTFLFSATLTIPEGGRFQKDGKRKQHNALTVLESVMKRVGMRGRPAVVDMGIDDNSALYNEDETVMKKQQKNATLSLPAGLELCQHEVTDSTRDSYLYYFLTQYPGKTIVFLNAIHQVRKLAGLLTLLKLPVFALHAEMQQRQRLKKLDGFRAHQHGILIATDVAARGLDIPSVDYVVHYHVARSTEVFVHRSGRTARANKEGLSISLVAPVDAKYHTQICKMLQRPTGLSEFPFDHRFLPVIDERLRLAKAINEHDNVAGKVKSEETWFSQMAEAADLDLDDDLLAELKSKKDKSATTGKKNGESVESMRMELNRMLAEPLRPIGSVRKFRQLYQELGSKISNDGEYRKRNASEDLETKGKKSYKRFRRRK